MADMTPERIAEDLAEAWNRRDLDACLALLTDDVVWDDPAMPEPARGKEAVRQFSHAVLRAFPDFRYEIRRPICTAADGTRCAVAWRITGTHAARLTPPGYAATGRRADFEGVDLIDVRDGRACRIVTLFNVLVPAGQLLAVELPPPPGSWRERGVVWAQRARAAWVRTFKRPHGPEKPAT